MTDATEPAEASGATDAADAFMARVSAVIPAYNAERHLAACLASVLAQRGPFALEVIVVDDGSADATAEAARRFAGVRCIRQANGGPSAARNAGIAAAAGEFVAFLDADDRWEPGKLARQVTLLRAQPEVGFCSTAARVVDAEGRAVADWPCLADPASLPEALFLNGAAIAGSTSGVMARRTLLLEAGGFDTALRGFEDPDLWMRLAARARYACIPEVLTTVVRTPGSVSSRLPRMRAATLASYRKNRALLAPDRRGRWWHAACAGALTDYAKAAWRSGSRARALAWTLEALARAPLARGRLALGLLAVMLRGGRL
ncbi:MAG: glycosyltransferase family 2 protein [Rubrivivax sp.]|nr:glycosyltransferase family 2 protein [Rubrivivax sp.]